MSSLPYIEKRLADVIGLDMSRIGRSTLERVTRVRLRELGLADAAEYDALVRSSEAEFQAIVEAVVVPETWFFRDGEPFVALAEMLAQHWLPANPRRAARLLSVPCSTGEEPYSMTMSLLQAGVPAARFTVDAVDISAAALARARAGVYGPNSFRNADLSFRDRFFARHPDGFEIARDIRRSVHFWQGNLLAEGFLAGTLPYDFIYCRNVLIYFDAAAQTRAIRALHRLLAPDGVLFVGHAEGSLLAAPEFAPIDRVKVFAHRKSGAPGKNAKAGRGSATTFIRRDDVKSAQAPAPDPATADRPRNAATVPAARAPLSVRGLAEARELADRGRLEDAERLCHEALLRSEPSAELYYLLGVIHDAARALDKAEDCYRKAIYIEPQHGEALAHLALLLETRGLTAEARRLRRRAQKMAAPKPGALPDLQF